MTNVIELPCTFFRDIELLKQSSKDSYIPKKTGPSFIEEIEREIYDLAIHWSIEDAIKYQMAKEEKQ